GYPMIQIWSEMDDVPCLAPDDCEDCDDCENTWVTLFLTNATPFDFPLGTDDIEDGFYGSRAGTQYRGNHIDFADFSFRLNEIIGIMERPDGVREARFDDLPLAGEHFFRIRTRDLAGIVGYFPYLNMGSTDTDAELNPNAEPNPREPGNPIRIMVTDNPAPPIVEIDNSDRDQDQIDALPNIYITGIREAKISDDGWSEGQPVRDVFRLRTMVRHDDGVAVSGVYSIVDGRQVLTRGTGLLWNHPATGRRGVFTAVEYTSGSDAPFTWRPSPDRRSVVFTFTARSNLRDAGGDLIFTTHASEYELTLVARSVAGGTDDRATTYRLFSIRMDGVGPVVDIRRNVRGASPLPGDFRRILPHVPGGLVNDIPFIVNGNIQVSVDRSDPSTIMSHQAGMGPAHTLPGHPMVRWFVEPVPSGMTDAAFLANPPAGTVLYALNRHRVNPSRANLDFFYDIVETYHSGWVHQHSSLPIPPPGFQLDPANQTHNFKFATESFDDGAELWLYVMAMDGVHNLGFAMQRILVNQEDDRPQIVTPGLFHYNASDIAIDGPGELEVSLTGGTTPGGMIRGGNEVPGVVPRRNILGRDQGIELVFTDDDGIRLFDPGIPTYPNTFDDPAYWGGVMIMISDMSADPVVHGRILGHQLATILEGSGGVTPGAYTQLAGTLPQSMLATALGQTDRLRDGMYRIAIYVVDCDTAKVEIAGCFGSVYYNNNSATFYFAVRTADPQITLNDGIENMLMGMDPENIGGYITTPFGLQRLWIHFNPDVITLGPDGLFEQVSFHRVAGIDINLPLPQDDDAPRNADGLYTYRWFRNGIVFGNMPDPAVLDGFTDVQRRRFTNDVREFTLMAFDTLAYDGSSTYRVQVDNTPPAVGLRGINQGRPISVGAGGVIETVVWGNVSVEISATDNHEM
ncbi:MAG: hypothetical protein FWD88_07875, partial [Treponema sp.]|nr:hypothetical protein [Treponema sp.]